MRMKLFKFIVFLSIFIFVQGEVIPWVISNDVLPLWADIIILSAIIIAWFAIVDWIVNRALNILSKNDKIKSVIDYIFDASEG